jgi:hypothetical protein
MLEWLDHRRQHWPRTSSPFLFINHQAAMITAPLV